MRHPLAALLLVVRSSSVGTLATLVDLGLLTFLVELARLPPRVASLPSLVIGVAIQFVGNKLYAFRDHSSAWLEQALAFGLVELVGLVANWGLFDLVMAHSRLPYLPVRIAITSAVYFGICLPLWSRIFTKTLPESRCAGGEGSKPD